MLIADIIIVVVVRTMLILFGTFRVVFLLLAVDFTSFLPYISCSVLRYSSLYICYVRKLRGNDINK